MPQKKISKEKKPSKPKRRKKDKENSGKKENNKDFPEETSLEEKIEKIDEETKEKDFNEFLSEDNIGGFPDMHTESEDFSPSLERRHISQNIPVRLEESIEEMPINKISKISNPNEYISFNSNSENPQYMSYEGIQGENVKPFSEFERESAKNISDPLSSMQKAEFRFYEKENNSDQNSFEKYTPARMFEEKEWSNQNKSPLDNLQKADRKEMKYRSLK